MNVLSCGPKALNISGISDDIFPARHQQKSLQHERACAACDGKICSKNRKIVPYHGDSPNTRNGARLRSLSPIMASGFAVTLSLHPSPRCSLAAVPREPTRLYAKPGAHKRLLAKLQLSATRV